MKINQDKVKELFNKKPVKVGAAVGIAGLVLGAGFLGAVIVGAIGALVATEKKK